MIIFSISFLLIVTIAFFTKKSSDGGFPYARYLDKIGSGILMGLFGLYFGVDWYWCLATAVWSFAIKTLPLTKKGSSIWNAPWFVPIFCFCNGLIPMPLGLWEKWFLSLGLALGYTVFSSITIFQSNMSITSEDAKWSWVRTFNGALLAIICALTVVGSFNQ